MTEIQPLTDSHTSLRSVSAKRAMEGPKTPPQRDLPGRDPQLKRYQKQYLKRKERGLCTSTGCPKKAALAHTHCQKHLALMSRKYKQRYQRRSKQGLCIYCGERPGFWGVRCIICRQKFADNPLPFGARRAIHLYREAKRLLEIDHKQAEARFAARILLATGEIKEAEAKALRLYTGIDGGQWRTYEEVGRLMHLSKQRVHKLLSDLKVVLEVTLGDHANNSRHVSSHLQDTAAQDSCADGS